MRVATMLLVALGVAAAGSGPGCGKKAKRGLPPAESWDQTAAAGSMVPLDPAQRPRAMGQRAADPHAGVPGAPPLGDLDGAEMGGMGGMPHPHGDLPMGGGGNPHGDDGSFDVTQMGLPAPDPNRRIDPSRRVTGVLKVHAKTQGLVKPNGAIFLVAKRAGADGQPTGSPLAVAKLSWAGAAMPFELTEANAMIAGTELSGDVIVTARYDQDSEAMSKQAGDVAGQARVTVPADKVELVLDTVLQ